MKSLHTLAYFSLTILLCGCYNFNPFGESSIEARARQNKLPIIHSYAISTEGVNQHSRFAIRYRRADVEFRRARNENYLLEMTVMLETGLHERELLPELRVQMADGTFVELTPIEEVNEKYNHQWTESTSVVSTTPLVNGDCPPSTALAEDREVTRSQARIFNQFIYGLTCEEISLFGQKMIDKYEMYTKRSDLVFSPRVWQSEVVLKVMQGLSHELK